MIFEDNAAKTIMGMVRCFNALTVHDMEEKYNSRQDEVNVIEADTEQGRIVAVEKNNRFYPLNSLYSPQDASKQWAEQFDKPEINENSIIIVFGIADGKAILELSRQKMKSKIIVYEPCIDIFFKVMSFEEVMLLSQNENICIIVDGINDNYFFAVLQNVIDCSNYQLVVQSILPNYLELFKRKYQYMLEIYKNVVESLIFSRNTIIARGIEIQRNSYALTTDMINQRSIVQLMDIANKKGMQSIPAILVAAGPSLDKNVKELKKAKNKAFILVVDTALNTVLQNGIIPDMTISIDSRKPLVLFKNKMFKNVPIALAMNSNKDVVKLNISKHFYEIDEQSYLKRIFEKNKIKTEQLPTGGSVATSAFSLLHEMGFKTIILVGQDLAYPGGVEHTEKAYGRGNDNVNFEKKEYIEVEDNYGNKVLSETNMNLYRKWFENYIATYEDLSVINATEGGAKIAGTEFISLHEAIERYCTDEYEVSELLDIPPYLDESERTGIVGAIKNIPEQIKILEEYIGKAKKVYSKIDGLNGKGKTSSSQMNKAMAEIAQINEHIDGLYVSNMLQVYIAKTDYEIQAEVLKYKENDSALKLVNDFVEQGMKILDAYTEAITELRKDMPLVMADFE